LKAYFCHEKGFDGEWKPVVYHGSKPGKSVNHSDPERTAFHEIGPEFLGSDGVSPDFKALQTKYPI